jgi:hypothetical protein
VNRDTDLLPWIMSALLAVIAALGIAVAVSEHNPPSRSAASDERALPTAALSVPVAAPTPAPSDSAESPAPAAPGAPAPRVAAAPPQPQAPPLPAGEVWECMTDGQRTFSNAPCGPGASIRQLNPTNTMEASPEFAAAPSYEPEPGYTANYGDASALGSDNRTFVAVRGPVHYLGRRHESPLPRHDHHAAAVSR